MAICQNHDQSYHTDDSLKSEHTTQLATSTSGLISSFSTFVRDVIKHPFTSCIVQRMFVLAPSVLQDLEQQWGPGVDTECIIHCCHWRTTQSLTLTPTAVRAWGGHWVHHPLLSLADHTVANPHTHSSEGQGWILSASSTAVIGRPHSH